MIAPNPFQRSDWNRQSLHSDASRWLLWFYGNKLSVEQLPFGSCLSTGWTHGEETSPRRLVLSTAHPRGTQPPQPCCPASPTFEIQTRSRLSLGTKPTVPGHVSLQNAKPRVRLGILYTNCLHSSSQRLTAHEHSIPFQRVKLDLNLCTAGVLWPRLPVSLWPPCQSEEDTRVPPGPCSFWVLLPFLS